MGRTGSGWCMEFPICWRDKIFRESCISSMALDASRLRSTYFCLWTYTMPAISHRATEELLICLEVSSMKGILFCQREVRADFFVRDKPFAEKIDEVPVAPLKYQSCKLKLLSGIS